MKDVKKNVQPKDIILAEKRHEGLTALATRFDMTPEEMADVIKKYYPKMRAQLKSLKKDDASKVSLVIVTSKASSLTEYIPTSDTSEPVTEEHSTEQPTIEQPVGIQTAETELEQAYSKREEIKESLLNLELESKSISDEQAKIKSKLSNLALTLDKLEEERAKLQRDFDSLREKSNSLGKEFNALAEKAYENRKKLNEVEARIATLKRITILVSESGAIDSEVEIQTSDSWRDIADQEMAEEMTVKQIKSVASLIAFVRADNGEHNFEVLFENPQTEALYQHCLLRSN